MVFCKNCGEALVAEESIICVKCGVARGQGTGFCHNCGKSIAPQAVVCLNCGVLNKKPVLANAKSRLIAGLMGVFLGVFGIHNFYLGYSSRGTVQLIIALIGIVLSCARFGILVVVGVYIWGLVEGIMILMGRINTDGNGSPLGS